MLHIFIFFHMIYNHRVYTSRQHYPAGISIKNKFYQKIVILFSSYPLYSSEILFNGTIVDTEHGKKRRCFHDKNYIMLRNISLNYVK